MGQLCPQGFDSLEEWKRGHCTFILMSSLQIDEKTEDQKSRVLSQG